MSKRRFVVASKSIVDEQITARFWLALFATAVGLVLGAAPAAAHHIPGATYTGPFHNETLTVSPNGSSLTVNFSPTYGDSSSGGYSYPQWFPLAQGPFPIRTFAGSKPWDREHFANTGGCTTVNDPYGFGFAVGSYATVVGFYGPSRDGKSEVVVEVIGDTNMGEPYPPDCERAQFGLGFKGGFIGFTSASFKRSEECKWAKAAVKRAKRKLRKADSPQAKAKAKRKLTKLKQRYLCS